MLMIYVQIFVRLRAVRRIFRIRRNELVGYCKVFPRIDIRNQKYQDKALVRTVSQCDEISASRIQRKAPGSMER